jgi:hypothetical protein
LAFDFLKETAIRSFCFQDILGQRNVKIFAGTSRIRISRLIKKSITHAHDYSPAFCPIDAAMRCSGAV